MHRVNSSHLCCCQPTHFASGCVPFGGVSAIGCDNSLSSVAVSLMHVAFSPWSVLKWILDAVFCRYRIGATKDGPLVSGSVRSFIEQLGARTSAPGGGSASALVATVVSGRWWECVVGE